MQEISIFISTLPQQIEVTILPQPAPTPIVISMNAVGGIQGPKGEQGIQGMHGVKGDTGNDGYTPIKGIDYFDGEKGEKGDAGTNGTNGTDGYTPIKGVDYFDGENGTNGVDGQKGEKGEDGYTPIKGIDYFDGAQGIQGEQGIKGDTGNQGIQGDQGPKGDKGDTGTLSDTFTLPSVATPLPPTSDNLTVFAKNSAGRMALNTIGPSGLDTPLQPALFGNTVYLCLPSNGTGLPIFFGVQWTARNASGAQSTPALATTNFLTQMNRMLYSTTSAADTSSGIQSFRTLVARGNADGIGGFFFFARLGVATLAGEGQQIIVGLSALNAALTGEPSVQNNTIALCKDSTDANWFLVSRNGSTTTKTPTEHAVTANEVLDLTMFCKPNDSKITVRLVRRNDGLVIMDNVDIVDTLPVNTTFMYAHAQLRNTGTAVNVLALNRMYIETDI